MSRTQRAGGLERPFQIEGCAAVFLSSLELAAMVFGDAKGGSVSRNGSPVGAGGGGSTGGWASEGAPRHQW